MRVAVWREYDHVYMYMCMQVSCIHGRLALYPNLPNNYVLVFSYPARFRRGEELIEYLSGSGFC